MDTVLHLRNARYTDKSTVSDLIWGDGVEVECNILEDTCRRRAGDDNILQKGEKIYGETAIPGGRYEIKMQDSGHYKRKMPYLQDVPLYDGIMIHWGNFPKDTLGCLITGIYDEKVPDFVGQSQDTYNKFEKKLLAALAVGRVFISIGGRYTA